MARQEHCIAWKKTTLKPGWNTIPSRCWGATKNGQVFCGRHTYCGQDLLEIPFQKRVEMINVTSTRFHLLSVEKQQAFQAILPVLSQHVLDHNHDAPPPMRGVLRQQMVAEPAPDPPPH